MELNILMAGVGGQGILSIAFAFCNTALKEGLNVKQAEVHGMAQRGGAVQSNLRLADKPIHSDLIPKGQCDLLLAVEPLEALRYLEYLRPNGTVVTSTNSFVNIPNYPELEKVWSEFEQIKDVIFIDSAALAKKAGSGLAQSMVMFGAGSAVLPLKEKLFEETVVEMWQAKGEKVVGMNRAAFQAGRRMALFLKAAAKEGADHAKIRELTVSTDLDEVR